MNKTNRIFFKNNPFPKGHLINNFIWSAHLELGNDDKKPGLYFDFHLETDDYGAEDGYDELEGFEPETDWIAKIVWGNYHSCTISSTEWHYGGILVADDKIKINFEKLENRVLVADIPPIDMANDYDERAFHIYLLGHDGCADHKISFNKRNSDNSFNMEWNGKIALLYAGEESLDYEFSAFINNIKFDGIYFSDKIPLDESLKILSNYIEDYHNFELEQLSEKKEWQYRFSLKNN